MRLYMIISCSFIILQDMTQHQGFKNGWNWNDELPTTTRWKNSSWRVLSFPFAQRSSAGFSQKIDLPNMHFKPTLMQSWPITNSGSTIQMIPLLLNLSPSALSKGTRKYTNSEAIFYCVNLLRRIAQYYIKFPGCWGPPRPLRSYFHCLELQKYWSNIISWAQTSFQQSPEDVSW